MNVTEAVKKALPKIAQKVGGITKPSTTSEITTPHSVNTEKDGTQCIQSSRKYLKLLKIRDGP